MPHNFDVVRLKDSTDAPETDPEHPLPPHSPGPAAPLPGAAIPGYEILGELGRGGMGVVYKARQVRLNRLVALKVIIGGPLAGTVEKARFHMEAETVARLQHKNIVQVFDFGNYNGTEYIAFEYVDGPTVRAWQNWRPIEPYTAARIAVAVARGVQHAHDRGVIHRDLKPANILLAGVGPREPAAPDSVPLSDEPMTVPDSHGQVRVPKVMDFGLAKSIQGDSNLTQSGVACGTPNYMAPEQVRSGPNASLPAVDVWGLGAVLFEMLTGHPPFTGWNAATIMQEILLSEPPTLRKVAPSVPYDLTVVVGKCLEKDPTRRYLSPGDVADDLERFLNGKPILARALGPTQRLRRWVGRNPLAALLGAVMVVGLVAVAAFAVKLNELANREREATERERLAREDEARHRRQAEDAQRQAEDAQRQADVARRAAEIARDETASALKATEKALGQARGERDRAENNFDIAHQTVRGILSTLSSHSEGENAALVPVYRELLTGIEPFVAKMLAQKPKDRDLRFDRAAIARGRGFLENTMGRLPAARDHLVAAATLYGELAKEYPNDRDVWREIGVTLACLGAISMDLNVPQAEKLLKDSLAMLEKYRTIFPNDVATLESMIRVHFALTSTPECRFSDEHERAVLDIVDQLAKLGVPSSRVRMLRAHALNNIASALTNRGKTDEAEMYWKEVLQIREELAKSEINDRVMRYELAKCLVNCSNQLLATGRRDMFLQFRQRAAGIFDSLNDDAMNRATYLPMMVDNDYMLALECLKLKQPEGALSRLNNAVTLNNILLKFDAKQVRARVIHVDLHTRRAEIHEQAKRHDLAARDYQVAAEYGMAGPLRDYCSAKHVQELVRAGDYRKAADVAGKLKPESFSHPMPCLELARGWLLILQAVNGDQMILPAERAMHASRALQNARGAVRLAIDKNLFQDRAQVRAFHAQEDFKPVWDMVPRLGD